jgi:hypothetical protein
MSSFVAERESSRCSARVMQQRRFECYAYIKHCFPGDDLRSHELVTKFEDMYCEKFSCLHEGRNTNGAEINLRTTEEVF